MRRTWAVVLSLVALLVLGACSSSSEPGVRAATASFQQALAQRDGAAACRLLSSEARDSLQAATGQDCAAALTALALPVGDVRSTQVWGSEAQVTLTTQVLFLAEFRDGWHVTAAGCSPRPDQPYACPVRA